MDRFQISRFFLFALTMLIAISVPYSTLYADRNASTLASIESGTQLASLTVYWRNEGDKWTSSGLSATGIHLQTGHCAVDPSVIPYGSVISIPGVGTFLAVDTGKAVTSRRAAKRTGVTVEEKRALVIDLFFASRREAEQLANHGPKFTTITWWAPWCADSQADQARKQFQPEDWAKLESLGML